MSTADAHSDPGRDWAGPDLSRAAPRAAAFLCFACVDLLRVGDSGLHEETATCLSSRLTLEGSNTTPLPPPAHSPPSCAAEMEPEFWLWLLMVFGLFFKSWGNTVNPSRPQLLI